MRIFFLYWSLFRHVAMFHNFFEWTYISASFFNLKFAHTKTKQINSNKRLMTNHPSWYWDWCVTLNFRCKLRFLIHRFNTPFRCDTPIFSIEITLKWCVKSVYKNWSLKISVKFQLLVWYTNLKPTGILPLFLVFELYYN